jgi:2'-deoxynucleoside 5'-phosphate N-hydrolase
MIIYCAGPIRGDATYQKFFTKAIDYIESLGHTVLSEFSGKFSSTIPLTDKQTYKRDLKWIDGSKIMIAEISGPSLGVGFEISYAIFQRKLPVLAICNSEVQNISSMITGCDSPLLTIQKYKDEDDLKRIVKYYISKLSEK